MTLALRHAARSLLLCAFVWVAAAPHALAHLERSARESTRFFELVIGGRGAQLSYAIAFGEEPANEERRRMDLDHDGQISSDEAAAFTERFVLRLSESVTLSLDGRTLAPRWKPRLEMADRRVGTIAFLLELRAELPLSKGAHVFELNDRLELPRAGVGEVGLKEASGGRFVDSARGDAPATAERVLKLEGRARSVLEDRRIRFRFECDGTGPAPVSAAGPPASKSSGASRWVLAAGVGLVFALGGVWLWRRSRPRLC